MSERPPGAHRKLNNRLGGNTPGHELLKLGAGQVQTGPVSVSHRFVFRRSQVG